MILHAFYVEDADGTRYIGVPMRKGSVPFKKTFEWATSPGGSIEWSRVTDKGIYHNYILQELIDFSQLPEPSWKDESPMEIFINLSINNVTYMYED